MARTGSVILDNNDPFPALELQLVSGDTLKLPQGTGEGYGVLLFYRGYWWPFCRQQLADFQALLKDFESEQIKVIAASVDPIEKAKEFVEKIGVTYPVGYGLHAEEISRVTGAFYEKERKFLHATGFVIRPDKTIANACYSSGPIGRLTARDTLSLIKFYKSKK